MAKEKVSLEEQVRQADIEELHYKIQRDAKWMRFNEAQQAYEAVDKIYKRSRREWANAQRQHVKAVRKLERLRQQLNAASQDDRAAGVKNGQSRQHGNSGE